MSIPCDKTFVLVKGSGSSAWSRSVSSSSSFKNNSLKLAVFFLFVRVRAFISHRSIPCDKTFLLVPSSKLSAKVSFEGHTPTKCKTFTLDITFEWYDIRLSYFDMLIHCDNTFLFVTRPRSVFKVILSPWGPVFFFFTV